MTTSEITEELSRVFEQFLVAEYAYFTPKGEPLCWPVTPYWYPDRGVLAIATGLAYPNKADYAKQNPKVALLFSDPTGSGMETDPVLVQGDATVLDEDLQANTDRYVTELQRKFPVARFALNNLTVKLLDFYLPRLWVEITPRATPTRTSRATGTRKTEPPNPPHHVNKSLEEPVKRASMGAKQQQALRDKVDTFGEAVVTVKGPDGYPAMIRTGIAWGDGTVALADAPGEGPACLTFHRHSLGGTRFKAYLVRGYIEGDRFLPKRLVGFFGNGAVFPFSVIPNVPRLRRRLLKELARRGQEMPQLRVP